METKNFFGYFKESENRKLLASYLMFFAVIASILQIVLFYSFFSVPFNVSLIITYVTAVFVALSVVLVLDKQPNIIKILWAVLIGAFTITFIINGVALDYICNTIIFLGLLTVLPNIKIDKIVAYVFFGFYMVYILSVAIFANKFGQEGSLIVLNTNSSSFFCFCAEVMIIAFAFKFKLTGKIICYAFVAGLIVMQFLFDGRSSLIGTALVIIFLVLQKYLNKINGKVAKWIAGALFFGGIAFALAYLGLYKLFGDDVYFMGKDIFTGREIIWSDAFNQVNEKYGWFFGIGLRLDSLSVNGVTGFTNLHNQAMGYYVTFGAIVLIAYTFLLAKLVERLTCGKNKMLTVLLFVLIIMSYFDTILYSTTNGVHLIIVLMLVYHFTQTKEA